VSRPRRVIAVAVAVLVVATLSACSSTPSNRRVVSDVIESLQLPEAQEACMLAKLDENYSDDDLNAIAEENENWDPAGENWTTEQAREQASPSMLRYVADFQECTAEGGAAPASSQPTGSSEPSVSSPPTASAAPTPTSELAPTTS
jgi:hypothetical protein